MVEQKETAKSRDGRWGDVVADWEREVMRKPKDHARHRRRLGMGWGEV